MMAAMLASAILCIFKETQKEIESILEGPQWILSEVSLNVQQKNPYLLHHGGDTLKSLSKLAAVTFVNSTSSITP